MNLTGHIPTQPGIYKPYMFFVSNFSSSGIEKKSVYFHGSPPFSLERTEKQRLTGSLKNFWDPCFRKSTKKSCFFFIGHIEKVGSVKSNFKFVCFLSKKSKTNLRNKISSSFFKKFDNTKNIFSFGKKSWLQRAFRELLTTWWKQKSFYGLLFSFENNNFCRHVSLFFYVSCQAQKILVLF